MQKYLTNPPLFSQDKKNAPLENIAHWVGVDEAGRGALAGPVVAGAVLLPKKVDIPGLTDSKKLTPAQRGRLAEEIRQKATCWGIGFVWQEDIDKFNILEATFMAMSRAVSIVYFFRQSGRLAQNSQNYQKAQNQLVPPSFLPHQNNLPHPAVLPQGILIDGLHTIPKTYLTLAAKRHAPKRWGEPEDQDAQGTDLLAQIKQRAIVKGDSLVLSIAAASILAKTGRDRFMLAAERRWPSYGFSQHKGYGTKEHLAALENIGPCKLHRLSFAPCRPDKQKDLFL